MRDRLRAAALDATLMQYAAANGPLSGIERPAERAVLVAQLVESLHRVSFPRRLLERDTSVRRADPSDVEFFDPLRAAILHLRSGSYDEACWLVYLFVLFGKGKRTGWRLLRDVYGRLGQGGRWDWATVVQNPHDFYDWVSSHSEGLWPEGTPRPFGAHRQHESVTESGRSGESYATWIGSKGHHAKFATVMAANGHNPYRSFDALYREMDEVHRFGRLAKFDYLSMLGKLELLPIESGSAYMQGSTGPIKGARLLFTGDSRASVSADSLDAALRVLDAALQVGMQVLEDALCNWQKSPAIFKAFRG